MGVITVEAALLLVGALLYRRATSATERAAGAASGRANLVTALIVASGLVVLLLDVLVV